MKDELTALPGLGPKRAEILKEHGVHRPVDLLWILPRRYEDRRTLTPLGSVEEGPTTVAGSLVRLSFHRRRRRGFSWVEGRVQDSEGTLDLVWFNQPWLKNRLRKGEAYCFWGTVQVKDGGQQMVVQSFSILGENRPTIIPIYPNWKGIGVRRLERWIREVLAESEELEDWIPSPWRSQLQLPSIHEALTALHCPDDDRLPPELGGSESPMGRLVYGELLAWQRELWLRRPQRPKNHAYISQSQEEIENRLPFTLTKGQRRAWETIGQLMDQPLPMRVLLQGDVGCGKTALAALALGRVGYAGLQGAMLVPTEILARQVRRALQELLGRRVALFTAGTKNPQTLEGLASGEVSLVVGTHALLQPTVKFRRLALAVVDEQHRFGVEQREGLLAKGLGVDLLVMTATPIPRTLARTYYSDLEVAVVQGKPQGRGEVTTSLCSSRSRDKLYHRLLEAVLRGERAMVVFPRIDESDQSRLAELNGLGRRLRQLLEPGVTVVSVHGRQSAEERWRGLEAFRQGEAQVLLATTVIEVGVDVPEATIMIIESADSFGLAQLHQLRGRVGRGAKPSWCVAVYPAGLAPESKERLEAFARLGDGFTLAEEDLRLRGSGELLGQKQSGAAGFRVFRPQEHSRWVEQARKDAQRQDFPRASTLTQELERPRFSQLSDSLTPK